MRRKDASLLSLQLYYWCATCQWLVVAVGRYGRGENHCITLLASCAILESQVAQHDGP